MPGPLANWVVNATVIITNVNWGFRHPFTILWNYSCAIRKRQVEWRGRCLRRECGSEWSQELRSFFNGVNRGGRKCTRKGEGDGSVDREGKHESRKIRCEDDDRNRRDFMVRLRVRRLEQFYLTRTRAFTF
jgi:hypothetical protein